jgi:hypothetical protein
MKTLFLVGASLCLLCGPSFAQDMLPEDRNVSAPEERAGGGEGGHHDRDDREKAHGDMGRDGGPRGHKRPDHHGMESRAAHFKFDAGPGGGKIDIKCADEDSTDECAEAVLPLIEALGQRMRQGSGTGEDTGQPGAPPPNITLPSPAQ